MKNYKSLLKNINTFIFDYDGVLTDGTVILTNNGDFLRTANVKDGYAMQLALKKGYNVAIVTGGRSESIRQRFLVLNVHDVYLGVENKIDVFRKYLEERGIKKEQVLYIGDDIPDYHSMKESGIAACPADACEEIKSISHYISPFRGGRGCARDVIEQVLKAQGKWMSDEAFTW